MTALIPTVIDLDGTAGSLAPATLVGGPIPWATDDGDTSYISMVPFRLGASYCTLELPPGLPESWFYTPVYDIVVRSSGSEAVPFFRVDMHSGPAFDGLSFLRDFAPGPTYVSHRFTETGDPTWAAAAWALYSTGGTIYLELFTSTTAGDPSVPDPALSSMRVTYLALWLDDVIPPRVPLRGRQRGSGVSGSTPMRGRSNSPYGLRGRQESNR